MTKIKRFKRQMEDQFHRKDLGAVSWYSGMKVTRIRESRTFYIDQATYIQKMLYEVGTSNCKSCKTPMDSSIELRKNYRTETQNYQASSKEIQGYQPLVEELLWIACMIRPAIAYAEAKCTRYSTKLRMRLLPSKSTNALLPIANVSGMELPSRYQSRRRPSSHIASLSYGFSNTATPSSPPVPGIKVNR